VPRAARVARRRRYESRMACGTVIVTTHGRRKHSSTPPTPCCKTPYEPLVHIVSLSPSPSPSSTPASPSPSPPRPSPSTPPSPSSSTASLAPSAAAAAEAKALLDERLLDPGLSLLPPPLLADALPELMRLERCSAPGVRLSAGPLPGSSASSWAGAIFRLYSREMRARALSLWGRWGDRGSALG